MRYSRLALTFVTICCLMGSAIQSAKADDHVVVADRLYDMAGSLEITLTPTMSIFDKYTKHVAASVGLGYYFNDYLGIEAEGGYAFISGDKKLLDEILRVGVDNVSGIERLPLSDLKHMTWFASGSVILNPLYGKISLSAESDFNFHFYLIAGAGVAGFKYSTLEWPTASEFRKVDKDAGMKPTFHFGGGIRIHFPKGFSLRIELRDQFSYDEYDAQTKSEGGITPTEKKITDFIHITTLRFGVCYSFL